MVLGVDAVLIGLLVLSAILALGLVWLYVARELRRLDRWL